MARGSVPRMALAPTARFYRAFAATVAVAGALGALVFWPHKGGGVGLKVASPPAGHGLDVPNRSQRKPPEVAAAAVMPAETDEDGFDHAVLSFLGVQEPQAENPRDREMRKFREQQAQRRRKRSERYRRKRQSAPAQQGPEQAPAAQL